MSVSRFKSGAAVLAGTALLLAFATADGLTLAFTGVAEPPAGSDKPTWRDTLTIKHEQPITAVACSSDWSAAGDEGGNLFAWETKTGNNRTLVCKGGKQTIISTVDRLQFTADGKHLYCIFSVRGGSRGIERFTLPWKDKKGGGLGGGDERSFISVSADGETWLTSEKRGRLLGLRPCLFTRNALDYETVEYKPEMSHALLSADDKWLAVVTTDGNLHIHDRASLQETHTIAVGKKGVVITAVQFSADGQRIAVARDDAFAKVYDTAKGKEVATLKGHGGIVFTVAFSPDGKRVVTGGDDNTARVWDATTGKALATLERHTDSVRCAAFDPSGEILVTGSADKTVKLWRAR